ncbi:MAG TPA: hypothetical protein VGI78_27630 [Acetobacteraceae bacterium]|jgi:hypothetical protein
MSAAGSIGVAAPTHHQRATQALSGRSPTAPTEPDLMPLTGGVWSALLWGLFGMALYVLIASG